MFQLSILDCKLERKKWWEKLKIYLQISYVCTRQVIAESDEEDAQLTQFYWYFETRHDDLHRDAAWRNIMKGNNVIFFVLFHILRFFSRNWLTRLKIESSHESVMCRVRSLSFSFHLVAARFGNASTVNKKKIEKTTQDSRQMPSSQAGQLWSRRNMKIWNLLVCWLIAEKF